MNLNTFLLCFCYWLVTGIEAADLMDTALLGEIYKHTIYTTEAIICIVMIITNSYAIVTLCSYISPISQSGDTDRKYDKKFDFLYKAFVSAGGVFFAEIPLLVARLQILSADGAQFLSATFFMWLTKDILFIVLIILSILVQKFGSKAMKIPCKFTFDNNIIFQPEKRDEYIVKEKCVRFKEPPVIISIEKEPKAEGPRKSSLKQKVYENFNKDLITPLAISQSPATSNRSSDSRRPIEHTTGGKDHVGNIMNNYSDCTHQNKSDWITQAPTRNSVDQVPQYNENGHKVKQVSFQVKADTPCNPVNAQRS